MLKSGNALALLTVTALLSGCQSAPEKQVTVTYRETIQFHTYLQADGDNNPMGVLGFASYFTISCISNNGRRPADFTFDVRRVHLDTQSSQNRPITAKIASTIPATGWSNSLLAADTVNVPAGQRTALTQPYAFVIAVQPSQVSDQGAVHELNYDSNADQPVVMRPDPSQPDPLYKWGTDASDFRIGQRVEAPARSSATCTG